MKIRRQGFFARRHRNDISKIIGRFNEKIGPFLPEKSTFVSFNNFGYEGEKTTVKGKRAALLNQNGQKNGNVTYYSTGEKNGRVRIDFTFTYGSNLEQNVIAAVHRFAHDCDLTMKTLYNQESPKQSLRSKNLLSKTPSRFWYDATKRNVSIQQLDAAEDDVISKYRKLIRRCDRYTSPHAPSEVRRYDLYVQSQRQGQLTIIRREKEEKLFDSMISLMYKEGLGVENIKQFTRFMIHNGYELEKADPSYDE